MANSNKAGIQELGDGGSSGTRMGTASTDLIGFLGATPITQVGATIDLGVVLSNMGIRAAGTAYTITTSGAIALTGTVSLTNLTITNDLTISDAGNIICSTGTGTQIGTAVTQKLGFWAVTPVVQPAAAGQATNAVAAGATSTSTIIASNQSGIAANKTLVNAIQTALVNSGIMKGSA